MFARFLTRNGTTGRKAKLTPMQWAVNTTLEGLEARKLFSSTITVTSQNDGPNNFADELVTLREAITAANSENAAFALTPTQIINTQDQDTVQFNIPGGGTRQIALQTDLPTITAAVRILGNTQPLSPNAPFTVPLIELDGGAIAGSLDALRFDIAAAEPGDVEVRGLAINEFDQDGIDIRGSGTRTYTIANNIIGLNPGGTVDEGNGSDGIVVAAEATTVTTEITGNVISGNNDFGIAILGAGTVNITNNRIGTNLDGSAAIGNGLAADPAGGVNVQEPGTIVTFTNNTISGNIGDGIINSGRPVAITGNRIGVAANGTTALGNSRDGIRTAGGLAPTTGSTITGNTISSNGVIGLNITSGGLLSVTGNTLTGNGQFGVSIAGVSVDPNGTTFTGNTVTGNGANPGVGVTGGGLQLLEGADGLTVSGNTFSNNTGDGLRLNGADNVSVFGNTINANSQDGIDIEAGSNDNRIGIIPGTDPDPDTGAANTIQNNGQAGVANSGVGNSVLSNVIANNGGPGIDLADNNLNNGQRPDILAVFSAPSGTTVVGNLPGIAAGSEVLLQFFTTTEANPEGDILFAQTTVIAGDQFVVTLPTSAVGTVFTATATVTGPLGNTSEFSDPDTSTAPPPPPLITVQNSSVLEGPNGAFTEMTFTVTRTSTGGSTAFPFNTLFPTSFTYSTRDGSATLADNDYLAETGTLTIPSGATSATFTITVIGDNTPENNESFFVDLTDVNNGTTLASSATGTILNDDGNANNNTAFTVDAPSVLEGNAGTASLVFTITRSDISGDPSLPGLNTQQTVNIRTLAPVVPPETLPTLTTLATSGGDFLPVNTTVTFAPGQTTATIVVPIVGDTVVENNETVTLEVKPQTSLSNPNPVTTTGTGTIINDDVTTGVTLFTVSNASVLEGNAGTTTMTFTVTRSGLLTGTSTVDYYTRTGGTGDENDDPTFAIPTPTGGNPATGGVDYLATAGTLTFAPGQTSQTVTVTINGDTQAEPDETFQLVVTTPDNPGVPPTAQQVGTGTILNDDSGSGATQVSVSPVGVILTEGNSGNTPFSFVITRSGDLSQITVVDFYTQDGTAVAGSDFISQGIAQSIGSTNSAQIQFLPGETSKTVVVQVIGDTNAEADETFGLTLNFARNFNPVTGVPTGNGAGVDGVVSNTQGTLVSIVNNSSAGTITNDDGPALGSTYSINDVSQAEGNSGTTAFTFTVTRTNGNGAGSVNYATQFGNSNTDSNDLNFQSGTVNFASGETSKTITIFVKGDTKVETDNLFFVNLSNPTNGTIADGQGRGMIMNDDGIVNPPTSSISINDVSLAEGDSGNTAFTFTVTRTSGTGTASVQYSTQNGNAGTSSADLNFQSGTVNFAAGQTSKTITILVKGDTKAESDNLFFVNLTNAVNASILDGQGRGTIVNDD